MSEETEKELRDFVVAVVNHGLPEYAMKTGHALSPNFLIDQNYCRMLATEVLESCEKQKVSEEKRVDFKWDNDNGNNGLIKTAKTDERILFFQTLEEGVFVNNETENKIYKILRERYKKGKKKKKVKSFSFNSITDFFDHTKSICEQNKEWMKRLDLSTK